MARTKQTARRSVGFAASKRRHTSDLEEDSVHESCSASGESDADQEHATLLTLGELAPQPCTSTHQLEEKLPEIGDLDSGLATYFRSAGFRGYMKKSCLTPATLRLKSKELELQI